MQGAIRAREARLADKPMLDRLMAELAEQWRASTSMKPPQRRGAMSLRAEQSEGRDR